MSIKLLDAIASFGADTKGLEAGVARVTGAVDKKAVPALKRGTKAGQDMAKGLAKVGKDGGKGIEGIGTAADKAKGGFQRLTGSALSFFAHFAGPAALAGGVIAFFRAIEAEGERGVAAIDKNIDAMKRLLQVSNTLEELQTIRAESTALASATGMSNSDAMNLMFQARSFGMEDSAGFFGSLNNVTDPTAMMSSAYKFQQSFGADETGSPEALTNKFLAAAATSDVSVEQIAPAAIGASQLAAKAGMSDEDLLAALSVLSGTYKSPEEASTGLKQFSAQAAKLVGPQQGIEGIMAALAGMDPQELQKATQGNIEFGTAYSALKSLLPEVKQTRQSIIAAGAAAPGQGLAAQKVNIAYQDPQMAAGSLLAGSQARLEAAEMMGPGPQEALQDTMLNDINAAMLEQGKNFAQRWLMGTMAALADMTGNEGALRRWNEHLNPEKYPTGGGSAFSGSRTAIVMNGVTIMSNNPEELAEELAKKNEEALAANLQ